MLCCTSLFGFEFRVSFERKSPLAFSQTSTNLADREEGGFQWLFWSSGQLSRVEVSAFPAPKRGAFTSSMCSARGWSKSEFFLTPPLRTRSLASMASQTSQESQPLSLMLSGFRQDYFTLDTAVDLFKPCCVLVGRSCLALGRSWQGVQAKWLTQVLG